MMKKILLLLAFVMPMMASAYDAEVNGIYYNLDYKTFQAEVTYPTSPMDPFKYQGNVIIPDSIVYNGIKYNVTSIGWCAFESCSNPITVSIPNSVTSMDIAFYNCRGLTSITIPNSITSIKDRTFMYCTGLTSIEIPNSITSIGDMVFYGCYRLTSITIPNSVKTIGESAFANCFDRSLQIGLTSVTIGNGVTSIGKKAFEKCPIINSVYITDIAAWCSIDFEDLYSNPLSNRALPLFINDKEITDLVIPEGVTSIGKYAFFDCTGLTSVTIPNSVTEIGEEAFFNTRLTDIYCYAENVPSTQSGAFDPSYVNYATLYVPEASVAAYKAAEPWSGFGTIKTLSGEIPETPKCATPTISYIDGKLQFACETEDVKYVYNIVPMSPMSGEGLDITLPTTYKVTVYATKKGYDNSDVATKEINVGGTDASGVRGDVNLDGEVGMPDAMFIVNKILKGKFPDEK